MSLILLSSIFFIIVNDDLCSVHAFIIIMIIEHLKNDVLCLLRLIYCRNYCFEKIFGAFLYLIANDKLIEIIFIMFGKKMEKYQIIYNLFFKLNIKFFNLFLE